MAELIANFLSTDSFMPHGHCYLWKPSVLWLNVTSDFLIALSYFLISSCLFYLMRKRPDISFRKVFYLFSAFVFACGMTHLFEIWTVWFPDYAIQGLIKMLTAIVSLVTAAVLWPRLPSILSMPSHKSLNLMVERLQNEILDRQKIETVYRESEEKFRLLVSSVKDYAIFMLDPDGRVMTWNSGAEAIKKFTYDEVIGQHFSIFYLAESRLRNEPEEELKIARERGRFETEGYRLKKDGSQFWAHIVISSIIDSNGTLLGFVKVTHDDTEKRLTDQRLQNLNSELEQKVQQRTLEINRRVAQLRTITNALPMPLAEFDHEDRLLYANEHFLSWAKLDFENSIDVRIQDLMNPTQYEEIRPHFAQAKAGSKVEYQRSFFLDDREKFVKVNLIPDKSADHVVKTIVFVANDITEFIETQTALKQAKESADAANQAKSSFLANMSHEIRTPLGAVLGFAELIINLNEPSEEGAEYAATIRRNGELLSNIINDILDLSKIEAGKFNVEIKMVSMAEILTDLRTLLSLQAHERAIELLVIADEQTPQWIQTDPLRLRQILLNIVGNAIKFTRRGAVTVRINYQKVDPTKAVLSFDVEDMGEGISPEQAAQLFTPFTQADISTTRKFGGTGLGLIIARHLARLLGGDVILKRSAPGQGSLFTITIDPGDGRQSAAPLHASLRKNLSSDSSKNAAISHRLDGLNILVVDDATDNQVLIGHMLKRVGARVDTAHNGAQAILRVENQVYDILFMDLQMPVMDGYEATVELRQRGCSTPIIALTAHVLMDVEKNCLAKGFTDYLSKPIKYGELIECIRQHTQAEQLPTP